MGLGGEARARVDPMAGSDESEDTHQGECDYSNHFITSCD